MDSALEVKLRSEHNSPRIQRRRVCPERPVDLLPLRIEPSSGIHALETRMVEQVVKLEAKLQLALFVRRERNILIHRKVEDVDPGPANRVLRCVADAEIRFRRRLYDIRVEKAGKPPGNPRKVLSPPPPHPAVHS